MTSSLSRTWTLTATQPGSYTIGAAQVKVGGGVVSTEPITIEVTKGTAKASDPYAFDEITDGDLDLALQAETATP
jgi:hypothetical protein